MTTVVTRGAASAQALGYAARATAANYIEDVFSTYLYTGNSSTQTITNGIDLSTKGGLVWSKWRSGGGLSFGNNRFYDTARGVTKYLDSNSTNEERTETQGLTAFNSNGYSLGLNSQTNVTDGAYASWTFRKQAKFFDVVTYTGNGASGYRMINHSLGSVPGFIIIKPTSTTGNWVTLARQSAGTYVYGMFLNTTGSGNGGWDPVANGWLTSTQFTTYIGNTEAETNTNGVTYVAYLFAHDAGGFGASGSDNVISCGSFTTDGSENSTTNLGYEPQWLMLKATSGSTAGSQPWRIFDSMRGLTVAGQDDASLQPNQTNAESQVNRIGITSTGFTTNAFGANTTLIYIAIRRGPMRTPTSGTSVFSPNISSGGSSTEITTGFPSDLAIYNLRGGTASNSPFVDRLRGLAVDSSATSNALISSSTAAEAGYNIGYEFWNTGFKIGSYFASNSNVFYSFRRAPGFFDEVCYTGTGSARTVNHNLGVVPELMIVKYRSGSSDEDWIVYSSATGNSSLLFLNTNNAVINGLNNWNNTTPSSTTFSLGGGGTYGNINGNNYVAYLFATCPGVSKVGSYTGTGTTKQIDCGFTGGARFVLIKRTNSTGDWYVWDSARGIVAGNDPYLLLNSTAAEVTNTDYVDTYSAGFEISSTAPAAINANGGTFIFLAIA